MRRTVLLLAALLPACGGTLYQTTRAQSTAAPDDVLLCVHNALQKQGFRRTQHDTIERWYMAEKEDTEARVSGGLYRKTVNVIDARVRPDSVTGVSTIELAVHTFDEFTTTRGPDRTERKVSDRGKLELRALEQACAQ